MSTYRIDLPVFNGPLDLLLHLIERDELDITAVSLSQVTAQYLAQIEEMKAKRVDELIDFLSVGARLVLIKSRALLPRTPALPGAEEEEEDPGEALVRQLRAYKRFKEAARWLERRLGAGLRTYLRVAPPPRIEGRLDLTGVSLDTLQFALQDLLERTDLLEESVNLIQPRRLTIEDQLSHFRSRLAEGQALYFNEMLSRGADQTEVALTLLALLELIKRREARAYQTMLFGPIQITAETPDPQSTSPVDWDS
jgi:segregation and condensation protein A